MRYLIVVLLFASCISARKATDYLDQNRKLAADYCAVTFPPNISTDTRAYDSTSAIIDSLVEKYHGLRDATDADRQQLLDQIRQLSYAKPECDTIRLVAEKIVYRDKRTDKAADKAVEAARDIKPVVKTEENTAALAALQLRFNECADAGLALSRENEVLRDARKGKILVPWWLVVICGGYAAVSIWRKSINPLKWLS